MRKKCRIFSPAALCFALLVIFSTAASFQAFPAGGQKQENPYAKWKNGLPDDENFFPIAVWLQAPNNARKFKELGFNLYVGLWKGPTAEQLAALKAAEMPVICQQNEIGLGDRNNEIIVGWMHRDEPDNAQPLGEGVKGYGPPIEPKSIVEDYKRMVKADPSRPIFLNLSQGVAWDNWHGRGVRTRHPEDYPDYIKGCDIVSFDIYPVVHDKPEVAGKLELVAYGVDRLREWGKGERIVWNCIECTRISNVNVKPSPAQVRSEVWMSLIHGSRGLIYFVHQFKPNFIEAAIFADQEMANAVGDLNRQILSLAPVLNSPTLPDEATVKSSDPEIPIDIMVKKHKDATYIFAANMRGRPATGSFVCKRKTASVAEVLGEERKIKLSKGAFSDEFAGYAVHLYVIR